MLYENSERLKAKMQKILGAKKRQMAVPLLGNYCGRTGGRRSRASWRCGGGGCRSFPRCTSRTEIRGLGPMRCERSSERHIRTINSIQGDAQRATEKERSMCVQFEGESDLLALASRLLRLALQHKVRWVRVAELNVLLQRVTNIRSDTEKGEEHKDGSAYPAQVQAQVRAAVTRRGRTCSSSIPLSMRISASSGEPLESSAAAASISRMTRAMNSERNSSSRSASTCESCQRLSHKGRGTQAQTTGKASKHAQTQALGTGAHT
jgi:hypothetical protein